MVQSAILGFPRIGARRELKKALEQFWRGEIAADALEATARELRAANWRRQADAGVDHIASNDFSFYDHVLDTAVMVGAIPPRFGDEATALDTYFAMARGSDAAPALEMTKWLDTNYHYMVPELTADTSFRLTANRPLDAWNEAKALGVETRPVLVGPLSFLVLAKSKEEGFDPLQRIDDLVAVYAQVLSELSGAGVGWVQIDEPVLALDLDDAQLDALETAYGSLAAAAPDLKILLTSYFGPYGPNLKRAAGLPVAGLHFDLTRGGEELAAGLDALGSDKVASLGLVDGRNIWRTDLTAALQTVRDTAAKLGDERVIVASSCSLLHSPVDLNRETKLDDELKSWLAFAVQKVDEVVAIAQAANGTLPSTADSFVDSDAAVASRKTSKRIHNDEVKARSASVNDAWLTRQSPYPARREAQRAALDLPPLPTTTIGSFPQTKDVRQARAANRRGDLDDAAYTKFLQEKTDDCIRRQEAIGLDVLVHGEFERNDMVEYFGEQLDGFAFTANGWVQSYGSRCVKPPIIFGDVSRPNPMTVEWSRYAQSQTDKPMKGMLTGPVTILQWSFVRDDQPRSETTKQIALAIRDEVVDLETAGIRAVQIDEPALREGLPLRQADWPAYLKWAVEAFRLSASGVRDDTQIHTHMCYSEFNDIIESIGALDADVISVETSRSDMELLDAFTAYRYPAEIGPGVYDIHSPRVPDTSVMRDLLEKALKVLAPEQVWVNPDCGLKTRDWPEVESALANMVTAARDLRSQLARPQAAAE